MWTVIDKRVVWNSAEPPPVGWNIWGQVVDARARNEVREIIRQEGIRYLEIVARNGRFMENVPARVEFLNARHTRRWPVPAIDDTEALLMFETARGDNFEEAEIEEAPVMERRVPMPAFKHPYDGIEEARRRLGNSIIILKGIPYYVSDVRQSVNTEYIVHSIRLMGLRRLKVPFTKIDDLRSPPPGYLSFQDDEVYGTYWFARLPARITVQGLPIWG
jgi:hypothetical protein